MTKRNAAILCAVASLSLAACTSIPRQRALENDLFEVEIDEQAAVRVRDKATGVEWRLGSPRLVLKDGNVVPVAAAPQLVRRGGALAYDGPAGTRFRLAMAADPPSVEYSCEPGPGVEEVYLLDKALPLTQREQTYYAVPHRLGILVPPEGREPFRHRFPAYRTGDGYSMAMFGAVHNGAAILLSWDDPYTDILVDYVTAPAPRLSMGLALRRTARSVRIQPLGRGGYVEIAKAYRTIARRRGFLKTLEEKRRENPNVERFFGAADFKPFLYMRRVANTRWNRTDKTVYDRNFTFEEAARLAEHFQRDLGMDRALFVLNGWIHAGYDNKHPDVLPAAPEIGGNRGLAECARRVKQAGFLFGLHDNYQDMYRDAPSWDETYLIKNPDGSPRQGGVWAGGQCWLICSRKSIELASRPQNVPGVIEICRPDLYFSDTIFAAPLYECFDEAHPASLADDLAHKQKLCDYLRGQVGLFGSEEGREWGVAHADYFEGLMSHKTGFNRRNRFDIIVPLFEIVFGDCLPIYAHQSDRPRPDEPEKILDHILYAEMPVYYFGRHIYWQDPAQEYQPKDPSKLLYAQGGRFGLIDQFIKNTYEVLSPLHRLTALRPMADHSFLTPDRKVERTRFGEDIEITVNYGQPDYTVSGAILPQYGFLVKSPTLVAYCARRYEDLEYAEPTLFVLQSLDGAPLASSGKIRVYRGFGGRRVKVAGTLHEVDGERLISAR